MSFITKAVTAAMILMSSVAPSFADALELVMFERAGCIYCARWDREVGATYPLTAEGRTAPLRKVNLDQKVEAMQLATPVRFSPTFVLLRDGREVGRITGYMDDATFWGMFSKMLERQSASTPGARS